MLRVIQELYNVQICLNGYCAFLGPRALPSWAETAHARPMRPSRPSYAFITGGRPRPRGHRTARERAARRYPPAHDAGHRAVIAQGARGAGRVGRPSRTLSARVLRAPFFPVRPRLVVKVAVFFAASIRKFWVVPVQPVTIVRDDFEPVYPERTCAHTVYFLAFPALTAVGVVIARAGPSTLPWRDRRDRPPDPINHDDQDKNTQKRAK